MQADNFSMQRYFERIGFVGEAHADIATVKKMMRCQLCSVPFENLDVQAGKIVSLVPEEIVDKIVSRNRGGYCYEVNGIFAMALQALGFSYSFVAARPMFYPTRRPKTHMAIIVHIESDDWLCDLGFGSYGIQEPMRLSATEVEVRQGYDRFILSQPNEREYLLKALVAGEWKNQYSFDLCPQEWIDFAPANYLNSTHPDAVFVLKLLVVLHNPEGRTILFGDVLKVFARGSVEQRAVIPEDYQSILSQQFGLGLSA